MGCLLSSGLRGTSAGGEGWDSLLPLLVLSALTGLGTCKAPRARGRERAGRGQCCVSSAVSRLSSGDVCGMTDRAAEDKSQTALESFGLDLLVCWLWGNQWPY